MIRRERVAHVVVGKKKHACRLAPQSDRYAEHRPGVERAVLFALELHRLHVRLARRHYVAADIAAETERELLRRGGVGAEPALEDPPPRFLARPTADLP